MNYDFGMVGLGTMGHALLQNMADHGFRVAGYDLDPAKVQAIEADGIAGFADVAAFVASLRPPRPVMLLVPAGAPVDAAISAMTPYLSAGDFLIDGGNSYYKDTDRRNKELLAQG
ncbi:MAG TPA: NAD(P)-binding domain-containing protein, partial [Fimbriimonas sp.]